MTPENMRTTAQCAGLSPVSERFPEERETLPRLFQEIPSFHPVAPIIAIVYPP
jgi:hypothetical protein